MGHAAQNEDLLIVEDNDTMRATLTRTLEPDFASVASAADGVAALEKIEHRNYGVVFTDFNMPGINGAELTKLILSKNPETVVVGTSVNNDLGTITAFKNAGARGFLRKEDASQLPDVLAAILN